MEVDFAISYYWLIAGALLLAIEAFGVPGIGFLFAGLAAVVVGVLIHLGVIDETNQVAQFAAFFAITAAFAALLWKKLKEWRTNPSSSDSYSNMVGDTAIVSGGGLQKGKQGQVSWSGTTMTAEIADDAGAEMLEDATVVTIVAVKGNKLIVAPKA